MAGLTGIYAGLLGTAVAASFLAGWNVKGWRIDSLDKKAQTQAQIEDQKTLDALKLELKESVGKRIKLAGELEVEKNNIKVKYVTLKQKVPQNVPQNTDKCNYDWSYGLVELLNNGARGEFGNPGSPSFTTGQLSGELSKELAGAPTK